MASNLLLPHNYHEIVLGADLHIDMSSQDKFNDQLHSGIFLNKNFTKYWVDKTSKINSFVLFARNLSITWGNDQRYWKWTHEKEPSGAYVEVAELLQVCWAEVKGKFNTKGLTPGTFYKLAFVVKFNDDASEWENLVNLKLDLPNGTQIQRKESFKNKPKNKWIEILVAEFRVHEGEKQGEMEFSMTETSNFHWKKGIVLNGVVIQPAI